MANARFSSNFHCVENLHEVIYITKEMNFMPNSLVHLKVANEISKKYVELDCPQYYLGIIAPDTVNLYGFAEKSKRWAAHIRAKDLNIWENNIIEFYKQNIEEYDNKYLFGYLIHVLTDIVFDRIYEKELLDKIHTRGEFEDEFGYYHQELRKYEASQINEIWWKDVISKLNQAEGITINSINATEIEKWRDKKIKEYDGKEKMKADMINQELIQRAANQVEEILIKNNIMK